MSEIFLRTPTIRKTDWSEMRPTVHSVSPELAKIIDGVDPSKKFGLYDVTIPYGRKCVINGKLHLPNKDGLMLPFDDPALPRNFVHDLSYNLGSNPVTLVLENSIEIFLEAEKNITMPLSQISEGALISTSLILGPQYNHQPAFLWNVCAGSRSIFSLPKLSVARKLEKLKRHFDIDIHAPLGFANHGNLFQALADSPQFGESWDARILYFGKKWFEHLDDKAWKNFSLYLHGCMLRSAAYFRYEFIWNLVFSLIQRRKNLKPDPQLADIVKHALLMGLGIYPGFAPATNNKLAPIDRIKEILTDIYQLEKYPPIIMAPAYFSMYKKCNPIYYFLAFPIAFDFAPKGRRSATKRADLADLHYIFGKYLDELEEDHLNLKNTPMCKVPELVKYDFFHAEASSSHGIRSSKEMPLEDHALMKSAKKGLQFPADSPLLKGCIRISNM